MNKETKRVIFQAALFIITFITTTLAGSEWAYGRSIWALDYGWKDFAGGLEFSIPLLLILTVHEFGHYFMAMYHKVKVSLPYYIPIPPIPFSIGTMGAVIRLRTRPESNIKHFDIGLAGPLAGFIVALIILFYGFRTLPPPEHIFQFHPDYKQYGLNYAEYVYRREYLNAHKGTVDLTIGRNLVFMIFEKLASDPARVPNPHEIMHYPILFATYIALFVTCLNLLPIGQLDGGHVIYGLFGFKIHKIIATVFFIILIFYAGLGLQYIQPSLPKEDLLISIPAYLVFLFLALSGLQRPFKDTVMYAVLMFAIQFLLMQYIPGIQGYEGWLLFGFVLGRFLGVRHPPSEIEMPLDPKRILLGWIALLVFVLCFSPAPLRLETIY